MTAAATAFDEASAGAQRRPGRPDRRPGSLDATGLLPSVGFKASTGPDPSAGGSRCRPQPERMTALRACQSSPGNVRRGCWRCWASWPSCRARSGCSWACSVAAGTGAPRTCGAVLAHRDRRGEAVALGAFSGGRRLAMAIPPFRSRRATGSPRRRVWYRNGGARAVWSWSARRTAGGAAPGLPARSWPSCAAGGAEDHRRDPRADSPEPHGGREARAPTSGPWALKAVGY
jgi:hypothetical protein